MAVRSGSTSHIASARVRDDQYALTTAGANQLSEDHADLDRLAEADGIRDEDVRTKVCGVECLVYGGPLVFERVGEHLVRHGELVRAQQHRCLAQRRLEPQLCAAIARRIVGDDPCCGGIEWSDLVEAW